MFPNFNKYNRKIDDIILNDRQYENKYETISLKTSLYKIVITAISECCSYSWIEKYKNNDFDILKNKIITSIKEIKFLENYEYDDKDNTFDCITSHLFQIKFTDNTSFDFLLLNSSNGYYDGYIRVEILL